MYLQGSGGGPGSTKDSNETEEPVALSFVWAPLSSAQLSRMGVGYFHRGFPRGPPRWECGPACAACPFPLPQN